MSLRASANGARNFALCGVLLCCSACATSRTMGVGDFIGPLSAGQTTISAATGVLLAHNDATPNFLDGLSSSPVSVALPTVEGSIGHAFNNWLALDVQGGPSGGQPGLRFTWRLGQVELAAEPSIGLGLRRDATTTDKNSALTSFLWAPGLRLQLSSKAGGFLALTYSQQRLLALGSSGASVEHDAGLVAGWAVRWKWLAIRPEVAALYTRQPELDSTTWFVFAGVGVELATQP